MTFVVWMTSRFIQSGDESTDKDGTRNDDDYSKFPELSMPSWAARTRCGACHEEIHLRQEELLDLLVPK